MKLLDGKVAVITGGGRGIGRAIAVEFAKNGADIVIAARNAKEMNETAREIRSLGRKALVVKTDVTKISDIKNMIGKTLKQFGKMNILVNNAGILEYSRLADESDKMIDSMVNVNILGVIHCAKETIPQMQKQGGGLIINISSVAGKHGHGELAVYCATKFAVIGFTEALADELTDENIMVYAICPTGTQTKMWEQFSDTPAPHVPEDVALEIMDLIRNMKRIPVGKAIDVRKHV